jgi:hypothetical protein
MDASKLPRGLQDLDALELAARYAPILLADEREPFEPVAVGYTIFHQEAASPSFVPRRVVGWADPGYPATLAVEYAIWWDWDIDHLYELEHSWTFVGADGKVVAVEASWHGMFGQVEVDGRPVTEGTHPVLLAQPGKHAMAASIEPFEEIREWAEQEAGPEAGKDGLLNSDLFGRCFPKSPENDEKVTAFLKKHAFSPSWKFDRRFEITRDMLVPWAALQEWIPHRIAWWLECL